MIFISDDHDLCPFSALFRHDIMDLFHKRAGRIHDLDPVLFGLLINASGHTMRADDQDVPFDLFKGILFIKYKNALSFQVFHHFIIVNDRSEREDLPSVRMFDLFMDQIDRPLHSEAEAGTFCKNHFHNPMIFATTSSMVSSEVSTSMASSALHKGEMARCMSL